MKRFFCVALSLALCMGLLSSLSVIGAATVGDGWTVLENTGEECLQGSLNVTEEGAFLLSAGRWSGYGVGSKKMFPLDENNSIDLVLNMTTGTTCGTGEGAERHRYFSVVLTGEALDRMVKTGATTSLSVANYIELRFYDTNDLDGTKVAQITASGYFAGFCDSQVTDKKTIEGFNANNEADETVGISVSGKDIVFKFNGNELFRLASCADALMGGACLSFGVSAYGAATITDTAVKTINGVAANSAAGTVEAKNCSGEISEYWNVCLPPEKAGNVIAAADGRFFISSGSYGGAGVFAVNPSKIRNTELEFDIKVPVGNIATGGPSQIRGFAVVLAAAPVTALKISGATAVTDCSGTVVIRISDSEDMDGTKLLYIIPEGDISYAAFGDITGPVLEPITLEGLNFKENPSMKLTLVADGRDLTVKVNGEQVAFVEGILRGFYGEAYLGFISTSYGSALCLGASSIKINGSPANDFDCGTVKNAPKNEAGCGNKA